MSGSFHAFASDQAKATFWDRFYHYAIQCGFEPWIVSLLINHYHALGYVKNGESLKKFMQRLHGSVAKLVNDLLPQRRAHFWRDTKGEEYFDGCIRDELQLRRAYRYTQTQAQRHGIVIVDALGYPHTRVDVDLEEAVRRARERGAFMTGIPYKRYDKQVRFRASR